MLGRRPDRRPPSAARSFFFFAPLFIPFFILGRADPRHRLRHRPPGHAAAPAWPTADKDHLHHRLMRLGHGQRRSVVILWAWTALLSGFVLYPGATPSQGDAARAHRRRRRSASLLYTCFHPGARRATSDAPWTRTPTLPDEADGYRVPTEGAASAVG